MIINSVLIADDDVDDIEILTDAITEFSSAIEISYVLDGIQLLDRLNKGPLPNVLILDLNMPCLGGKECLCEIRNNAKFKDIIIIIFSTVAMNKIKEECLNLGANYFVTKPSHVSGIMKFAEAISKGAFDFA